MKRQCCLFFVLLFILSSCKTHELVFTNDQVFVDQNTRRVTYKSLALTVPLNRDFYNLGDKKINLYSQDDQLSSPLKKYTYKIVQEAQASSDSIVSVIPGKMIVLKSDPSLFARESKEMNYCYQWDYKNDSWISCSITDAIPFDMNSDALAFYRSVYKNKKQNRVVVKDLFKGLTVIYILQGENSKIEDVTPSLFTTRVWSPPQFTNFITTAFYLRDKIDSVSQQIAIHLKNAARCGH